MLRSSSSSSGGSTDWPGRGSSSSNLSSIFGYHGRTLSKHTSALDAALSSFETPIMYPSKEKASAVTTDCSKTYKVSTRQSVLRTALSRSAMSEDAVASSCVERSSGLPTWEGVVALRLRTGVRRAGLRHQWHAHRGLNAIASASPPNFKTPLAPSLSPSSPPMLESMLSWRVEIKPTLTDSPDAIASISESF